MDTYFTAYQPQTIGNKIEKLHGQLVNSICFRTTTKIGHSLQLLALQTAD
jgi:hypothetical protein